MNGPSGPAARWWEHVQKTEDTKTNTNEYASRLQGNDARVRPSFQSRFKRTFQNLDNGTLSLQAISFQSEGRMESK